MHTSPTLAPTLAPTLIPTPAPTLAPAPRRARPATTPPAPAAPPVLALTATPAATRRVRATLAGGGLTNPVRGLHSTGDAARYLLARGPWQDRARHPLPAVVVADLHLLGDAPASSAITLLRLRRERPELQHIPVVVVGRDARDEEIDAVHDLGAAAYLAHTVAGSVLVDVIRGLGMRWSLAPAAS
ncbi:hypothetical protein [Nocardioides salarius]|uniref:hypothetical protein n=1 Tax=Nocardioides salarius TaxID=374513 RepID=UPI0030F9FC71